MVYKGAIVVQHTFGGC